MNRDLKAFSVVELPKRFLSDFPSILLEFAVILDYISLMKILDYVEGILIFFPFKFL